MVEGHGVTRAVVARAVVVRAASANGDRKGARHKRETTPVPRELVSQRAAVGGRYGLYEALGLCDCP